MRLQLLPLEAALSQPTVSHHLKVLREAGLVGSERQGLWAYYVNHARGAGHMADGLTTKDQIRETVRERYAEAAKRLDVIEGDCCGPSDSPFGCGNPTAVAELSAGEVVLDLGSGDGTDVLLPLGELSRPGDYGLDMTDEMLERARQNQRGRVSRTSSS